MKYDDIFQTFRYCISDQKCKGCPKENSCMINKKDQAIVIPKELALDVLNKMKELILYYENKEGILF